MIIPLLMARLIDYGIDGGELGYIWGMGIALAITAMISLFFGALAGKYAARASAGFARNLRKDMYYKVQEDVYKRQALEDAAKYYWTVTVTDKDGDTATSEPAYFEIAGKMDGAAWLCAGGENEAAPLFRKEMTLDANKTIASARLYMSAMGIYQAWINGQEVKSDVDDIFNPGWTAYERYLNYQTYDVTDMVKSGDNAIGAAVGGGWYQTAYSSNYANVFGPDDKAEERGLIGKLVVTYTDGTSTVVNTDNTWQVSQNSPYTYDDFWNGEHYDATIEAAIEGWNQAGYETDDTWKAADTTEYEGCLLYTSRCV